MGTRAPDLIQCETTLVYGQRTTLLANSGPLPLAAVANGPVSLEFTGTPPSIVVVTAIGVGTAHATSTRHGDEFFAPATPVAPTVHVLPAPLTVSVFSASKFYGSPTRVFGFVFDGLANGDTPDPAAVVGRYDDRRDHPAGTYSIRARTARKHRTTCSRIRARISWSFRRPSM